VDGRARVRGKVVPFIRPDPTLGQHASRRVYSVCHLNRRLLNSRMAHKKRPNQPAVPGPVVQRVSCRMNADKAAAAPNKVLQGCLLLRIGEHVASGRKEDENFVLSKIGISEKRWVFGRNHCEIVRGGESLDRLDAKWY